MRTKGTRGSALWGKAGGRRALALAFALLALATPANALAGKKDAGGAGVATGELSFLANWVW